MEKPHKAGEIVVEIFFANRASIQWLPSKSPPAASTRETVTKKTHEAAGLLSTTVETDPDRARC